MATNEQTGAGVVILGAGQAGGETALALRDLGYEGKITLVGDEPWLPYRRPPLSKAFLSGVIDIDSLLLASGEEYEQRGVEVRTGVRAEAIDRAAHVVRLNDGSELAYEKLVLALGGRPRRLPLPGAELGNVVCLRTADDATALRAALQPSRKMVLIGAGYVGLEVAAVAIRAGLSVTVLEAADRILARSASPEMSRFYHDIHAGEGVSIQVGQAPVAITGKDGVATGVELASGETIAADIVVVGVGLVPNVEIAEAAGVECENGIKIDENGQTSDPDILACGDCANQFFPELGRSYRLESVPAASGQAQAVAGTIVGEPEPYRDLPWFWSDQFDLKLQMAGLSQGYVRTVVRGNPESRAFCVFYLDDQSRVLAADAVNQPREHAQSKRLLGKSIGDRHGELADPTVALADFL
jgi:3-phenylpropionate/trans-cinnamate dioxygenase ferredoxin reductase subunit